MAVWNAIMLSEVRSGFRIDSEYYKEEYIEKDHILSKINTVPLWRIAKVTDGEHGSVKFVENGIKYLTAENIKQGYVDFNGVRFICSEVDQRNARARVNEGDILVSIKGTLGEIALAEKSLLPANMNRDVAIIKLYSNYFSGEYITPFLRSKFGAYQLSREGSGGVQQMITLERLKCVLIPLLDNSKQNEIGALHLKGLSLKQKSLSLYNQAQHLLESELGLHKLTFKRPVGYTARFSEVVSNDRVDADFYQVKYKQLDAIATKFPIKKVKEISEKLETGVYSQSYSVKGTMYLRGVDIDKGFIKSESILKMDLLLPNPNNTVVKNDIIVTRVGSIGVCAIIEDDHSGSLFSDNLIRVRLHEKGKEEIAAPYLNLLLNTTYGQMQMSRYSRGSVQQRLNQTQLAQMPIPIIEKEAQSKIKNLLDKHRSAKKESKKLLDQAKSRVEQLIEEAADKQGGNS